jgi:hypothetical protein
MIGSSFIANFPVAATGAASNLKIENALQAHVVTESGNLLTWQE